MNFNLPGSFKLWIVFIVAMVLIFSFGVGIYFFKENINEKNINLLYSKNISKNDSIKLLMENKIENANDILSRVSVIYSGVSKNRTNSTKDILKEIMSLSLVEWDFFEFSYYDSNMNFHKISNDSNPFDDSGNLGKERLSEVLKLTSGNYFFLCVDFCQIFIVKPLVPYDLNEGFIQLSVSVDNLIDEMVNNSYETDFLVYKKSKVVGDDGYIVIGNEKYIYELSTNDASNGVFPVNLNIDRKPFMYSLEGNKKIVNYEIWKDVVIFISEDVTSEINNSNKEIEKFIINSVFVLLVVLVVFYFLMTIAMRRISVLGFIFELITKNEFNKAKDFILRNARKKIMTK